jgi:hypothetical protein
MTKKNFIFFIVVPKFLIYLLLSFPLPELDDDLPPSEPLDEDPLDSDELGGGE